MDEKFKLFLEATDAHYREFIIEINDYLIEQGCKREIKPAKNGYLVSYILIDIKRTLATFVSRKTGMKLRIYPDHIGEYQSFLNALPEQVKKEIKKSSICKRLINPNECNSKCVMGFTFTMDDEDYQKCRYMAFMPTLSRENNIYIKEFLERELSARKR